MNRFAWTIALAVAGCAAGRSLDEERLSSPSPEVASCAQWFRALDGEVAAADAADLRYNRIPDFPYLRADRFLAALRGPAAAQPRVFDRLADRLIEHDLESRRYEIDNLPSSVVEKWWGMRFEDPRAVARARSAECARLLRRVDFANPRMRSALLERLAAPPRSSPGSACKASAPATAGARVRFSPPPAALSRAAVAGWLQRAQSDPLGQARIPEREFEALAAGYAPSLEFTVASDADRFGVMQWRREAARANVDATQPTVYVRRGYARYGEKTLLQIVYTVFFPEGSISWRVTLAPDGEPLAYDMSGADDCYAVVLTPRAVLRERSVGVLGELPRLHENERPLLAIAAGTHAIRVLGKVTGSDSLARYRLRPYDELRSLSMPGQRGHAVVGRAAPEDTGRMEARFAFDLAGTQP